MVGIAQRGLALQWIENYLHERKQYVEFRNVSSQFRTVQCGVPQGSILGPLLFLIYINDIAQSSNLLKFILFADDTTVFTAGKNLETLSETINTEIDQVSNWLKCINRNFFYFCLCSDVQQERWRG